MSTSPTLIALAAVDAIRGLGLETAPGVPLDPARVVRRKTPSLPPGIDPPAIVVVVGEAGAEGQTEPLSATKKLNRYPTLVVIITAAGGRALGDDDLVRDWRGAIEDELDDRGRTAFASVPGYNVTNTTGQAPFDGSVLGTDLNYSAQTFNIEVIEPRAT